MATAEISALEHASIEDVRRMKEQIPDNWAICEFTGDVESELMVAQTLHAAVINFDKHGEAYSIRGPGVRSIGPHVNNARGYQKLLDWKYIVEDERDGKVVIFPTVTLIKALDVHFARHSK
jgi:hypothetical protein